MLKANSNHMKKLFLLLLTITNLQLFADIKYLAEDVSITTGSGARRISAGTAVQVNGNTVTFKDLTFPAELAKFTANGEAPVVQNHQAESNPNTAKAIEAKNADRKKRFVELYDAVTKASRNTSAMTDKEVAQNNASLDELAALKRTMTSLEIRSAISGVSEEELRRYDTVPSQLKAGQLQAEMEWRHHMKEVSDRTDRMLEQLEKTLAK